MYSADADDIEPLSGIPQCGTGAPEPVVVAREGTVAVAYYVSTTSNLTNATPHDLEREEVAVVMFTGVRAMMFGAPNDEALHGHPLADRGLEAYAAHRVLHSSWIRALERMNSVHPMHSAAEFAQLKHVVMTFHDSTFECICRDEPEVSTGTALTPNAAAVTALASHD